MPATEPLAGVATQRGCLAVVDISGYTSYLAGSELTHAQDTLADLIETVVGVLVGPFRLAKLEGDAAFVTFEGEHPDASTVFDTIAATYRTFRNRVTSIARATSCQCNACTLIPSLDLKCVLHHGNYVRRVVAGSEELTGVDVIVVHRALKNGIGDALGVKAYSFLTDACIAAMGVDAEVLGLRRYQEAFDGVGEVSGWVADLEAQRLAEADRYRVRVDSATSGATSVSFRFDQPPARVWEWLSDPKRRVIWTPDLSRVDQATVGGLRGVGTTNHCVHGRDVVLEEILDWQPFESFTVRTVPAQPVLPAVLLTFTLTPTPDGGTSGQVLAAPVPGRRNALVWRGIRGSFRKIFSGLARDLADAMAAEDAQTAGAEV